MLKNSLNAVSFAENAILIAKSTQIKNQSLGQMISRKSLQTNEELIKVEHMLHSPKMRGEKKVEENPDLLNDQRDEIERIVRKRLKKMQKVLKPIQFAEPVAKSIASSV